MLSYWNGLFEAKGCKKEKAGFLCPYVERFNSHCEYLGCLWVI